MDFPRFLTALISLPLLLTTGVCPIVEAQETPTVKIGLILPLTGPMSSFGEDLARAVPLLERRFNSIQRKYRFQLLLEDGKFGHSNAAITAAKKLFAVDGVRFLMIGSSGETLQIAPFAESKRILSVAGFSSHPDVKDAGDYIFRTYIDAARGMRLVADDILKKNIERVAVISEETSFTMAIKRSLQKFLGDKVIFAEEFTFGEMDFNTLIAKMRQRQPQAYYLNISTPANFITLVRQLKANGVTEPLYTYYAPSLQDVQESLGTQLDGTIFLDFPDIPDVSQDFTTFIAELERSTGKVVRALFNFKANYNAVKVIFDGIMAVGPDPTKVKEYLYSYDAPSATGRLQFDVNGDAKNLNLVLTTFVTKE